MKNENEKFDYDKTLKTRQDDSFLNLQSYLYVTSKQITRLLFNTPITSHQVILVSMLLGISASYFIIQPDLISIIWGAVLLFYKNVLDKVDGSLARARGTDSRRGRFYDSLSDFIVTLALFSAISYSLYEKYQDQLVFLAGFAGMICSMLHCSYFIYYQVSFIKFTGRKTVNRLLENVTDEDRNTQDKWTLFLQRMFQIIYGWQDLLIYKLDKFMLNKVQDYQALWYKSKNFLTLTSLFSIGTHMILIAVFAVFKNFEMYLFVNLILMNLLLISSLIFHLNSVKKLVRS